VDSGRRRPAAPMTARPRALTFSEHCRV
jgi:hypothetical protein